MHDLEQKIRERAYYLWVGDGCPEGKADAFWLTAQRDLLASSLATPSAHPGTMSTGSEARTEPAPKASAPSTKKKKRRAA
jgi:hypothetical protein